MCVWRGELKSPGKYKGIFILFITSESTYCSDLEYCVGVHRGVDFLNKGYLSQQEKIVIAIVLAAF